ncbi:MAG: hypothetical protein AAGF33_05380 [Pseudomonadota bacterium]
MKPFDLDLISSPDIRREYDLVLQRAQALGKDVHAAYGTGKPPFVFRYVQSFQFNAAVEALPQYYLISIESSIPIFAITLFSRMMTNDAVLPHIPNQGSLAADYTLPGVVDPRDFDHRANWTIQTNDIRSYAALIYAEVCTFFVAAHEIGHVVAGHVDALEALGEKTCLLELVELEAFDADNAAMRRAWEIDADSVAAKLVVFYVEELVLRADKREDVSAILGKDRLSSAVAIVISALFVFFRYARSASSLIEVKGHHPHPIVRAINLYELLTNAAVERWRLNEKNFFEAFDQRFPEAMEAVSEIISEDFELVDESDTQDIDRALERLHLDRERFRFRSRRHSWIDWT